MDGVYIIFKILLKLYNYKMQEEKEFTKRKVKVKDFNIAFLGRNFGSGITFLSFAMFS